MATSKYYSATEGSSFWLQYQRNTAKVGSARDQKSDLKNDSESVISG